jgi:tagatose-1,6-bisphosphate aldolase non-catalytic subunit AgaZ/GatZ
MKIVPSRLGVGPVSKNAVDAAIEVAYERRERLMLIPSRRQIEAESQGGGYVEAWDTRGFARYVRERDPASLILLCRDHGGPYQHPREIRGSYTGAEAMKAAAESMREDIEAGFDLLHVDTSADLTGAADESTAIKRAVDLCGEMVDFARSTGHEPLFEFGFETQGPEVGDPDVFQAQVDQTMEQLRQRALRPPLFLVAQTGTKVMETSNIGHLKTVPRSVVGKLRELAAVVTGHGFALKAHNCDYLNHVDLGHLVEGGVDALNVAPELGVVETRAFLRLLRQLGLTSQADRFLELAYESNAWRKWMIPGSQAPPTQRAVIAGHYVYNTETFREIKRRAQQTAYPLDIDRHLRRRIAAVIDSYARALACQRIAAPAEEARCQPSLT